MSRFPEYILSRTFSICYKTFIICKNKFRHISVGNTGDLKLYSSLALFRMAWLFISHSVNTGTLFTSGFCWLQLYPTAWNKGWSTLGFRSSAPPLLFRNIQWPLSKTTVRGITELLKGYYNTWNIISGGERNKNNIGQNSLWSICLIFTNNTINPGNRMVVEE